MLVLAGVQPDTRLAREPAPNIGVRGAIAVDRQMRTGLPDIWAAGDCVETHQQLFDKPAYMPLGSTAHKQGRDRRRERDRWQAPSSPAASAPRSSRSSTSPSPPPAYARASPAPRGSTRSTSRDDHRRSQGLLPGRAPAAPADRRRPRQRPPARRADPRPRLRPGCPSASTTIATAIYHRMTIAEISDLDLSYTPPFSSPWDPVQIACQAWERAQQSQNKRASTVQVHMSSKPVRSHSRDGQASDLTARSASPLNA